MPLNDEAQVAIYNKLGLANYPAELYATFFTGWKEIPINEACLTTKEPFVGSGTAVGQLVRLFPDDRRGYRGVYVNLPGMEGGRFAPAERFDIGTERIHLDNVPPSEEIEAMLVAGLEKLNALIEEWRDKE